MSKVIKQVIIHNINEIHILKDVLSRLYPSATLKMDTPMLENGYWFLDFILDDYFLTIDYVKYSGVFGLTADPDHGFGEGAAELCYGFAITIKRIIELIDNAKLTIRGLITKTEIL